MNRFHSNQCKESRGNHVQWEKPACADSRAGFGRIRLLSRLSWYISHGGMVFTHLWPLLLWCYIVSLCFVAGPETSCGRKRRQRAKQWGCFFFFFLPVLSNAPVYERVNGCCCSVKAAASGVWQGVKKEAVEEQRVWRAASVSHFCLCRGRHTEEDPSLGWCWDYQKHFVFCESVTLPVILHSTPER